MNATVTNDGKGKPQSWEARVEWTDNGPNLHYLVILTGYGTDEREALAELENCAKLVRHRINMEIGE